MMSCFNYSRVVFGLDFILALALEVLPVLFGKLFGSILETINETLVSI